ncbi:hypothetical protein B7494_g710 [Chlorociboria aeruginascens]|nr:hypothetical protein B7494_g710 [Chlorociboria aeruginascens]
MQPILITLLTLLPTLGLSTILCAEPPVFTLHNIAYSAEEIYTTPAHLAVSQGFMAFNLTSTAVAYSTNCSAVSDMIPSFYYGNIVYQCDPLPGPAPVIASNFTYDEPTGQFSVNQTWNCDDGHNSYSYFASGTGSVNLTCEEESYYNANWTEGGPNPIYRELTTTCAPAELTIIPTDVSVVESTD